MVGGATLTQIFRVLKRIEDLLKNPRKQSVTLLGGTGGGGGSNPVSFDPHARFDTAQNLAITLGGAAVATAILPARSNRKYLRCSLVGAVVVNFSVGEDAVVNRGAKVTTATNNPAVWEPFPVPTGSISAINAVAGGIISVLEGF